MLEEKAGGTRGDWRREKAASKPKEDK